MEAQTKKMEKEKEGSTPILSFQALPSTKNIDY